MNLIGKLSRWVLEADWLLVSSWDRTQPQEFNIGLRENSMDKSEGDKGVERGLYDLHSVAKGWNLSSNLAGTAGNIQRFYSFELHLTSV